jgi:ComF family protein
MSGVSFRRCLVDFFFPPLCPLCRNVMTVNPANGFCAECLGQMKFLSHPFCSCCGLPFGSSAGEDHLCSRCLTEERYFAGARAVGFYEGGLAEAISRFKYQGATHLAKPLGKLLIDYRNTGFSFSDFEVILPTPSSRERLRDRGFNQALLLARQVSRAHSIPLNFEALRRIRHTLPQTKLSGPEREKNIRGAFEVHRPEAVKEKHILLIDDVLTTGATAGECAKVLRRAGAKQVDVLTLARAS